MKIYRQRVTDALDAITAGVTPFVEDSLRAVYKDRWEKVAKESFRQGRGRNGEDTLTHWDAHATLTVMWDQWNGIFRHKLGHAERSLVSELREYRNRWAHQAKFNFDDCYRILDSTQRLLQATNAPQAKRVARIKRDLFQEEFERQLREAQQRSRHRTRLFQDLLIYLVCCIATVAAILKYYTTAAWPIAMCVIAFFVFIGFKRYTERTAGVFGARECMDCRKIVYGGFCPYCDPAYGHVLDDLEGNAAQPTPLPEEPSEEMNRKERETVEAASPSTSG